MPRMDKIDRICTFLTIGRNSLLTDSNATTSQIVAESFSLSDAEKEMIKKYRRLTPEGKKTVLTILDLQYAAVAPTIKNDKAI